MASITSSSHRWVRSIGHSQSCYHLKPFIPLHSTSFLDILSVPCPLSVSSNPSQSHIDLHDTLPDVLFFSFQTHPTHAHHTHHKHTHNTTYWHIHSTFSSITFLLYTHTHTYIQPTQPQHLSFLDIARVFTWASIYLDDCSWFFPLIKTFMTLDPFYASSAVEVLYPYQTIMNSNHFSEAEWSASHLVCLVRQCSGLHSARLVFTQNLGFH